jgi:mRNA interferase MazF
MVNSTSYVPDFGDIVWINMNPQAGQEQAGRRPAMVISPKRYNSKTNLALFCPITSQMKGYPFEVVIPKEMPVKGVILSDQIKSLDWVAKEAQFIVSPPLGTVLEVLKKINTLITS